MVPESRRSSDVSVDGLVLTRQGVFRLNILAMVGSSLTVVRPSSGSTVKYTSFGVGSSLTATLPSGSKSAVKYAIVRVGTSLTAVRPSRRESAVARFVLLELATWVHVDGRFSFSVSATPHVLLKGVGGWRGGVLSRGGAA